MTITAETPVWDTPSGMGGTFNRYHPWREWDRYTFRVVRTELANPRRFADPTPRYRPPG